MPRSGPPAWMKSTSWRAGSDKPAKPPCPYLVNEQECSRGGYCRHNHDPARVRDWIRVRKAIPCIEFFAEGHCVRGSLCMYGHDFARRQRETAQRKDGLTHVFCAISLSGNTDVGGAIELTKATELASYNWLDSPEHAIAVPGFPKRFRHVQDLKVELDAVACPAEQAGPWAPHAFEAMMRSISIMAPDFDVSGVQLVTELNNLRRLLRAVLGEPPLQPFRIGLELMHDTLFMSRWTTELRHAPNNPSIGYGHSFERACCSYDEPLQASASHHRIISYTLGGLNCLVQYDANAYHCDCHGPGTELDSSASTPEGQQPEGGDAAEDEPSPATASTPMTAQMQTASGLTIRRMGSPITSSCLLELKTAKANANGKDHVIDPLPKLWLSLQTRLLAAKHKEGVFEPGTLKRLEHNVQAWRREHQAPLQQFVAVLKQIIGCMKERQTGGGHVRAAILYEPRDSKGSLAIYEQADEIRMLPKDLEAKLKPSGG